MEGVGASERDVSILGRLSDFCGGTNLDVERFDLGKKKSRVAYSGYKDRLEHTSSTYHAHILRSHGDSI